MCKLEMVMGCGKLVEINKSLMRMNRDKWIAITPEEQHDCGASIAVKNASDGVVYFNIACACGNEAPRFMRIEIGA